MQCITACGVPQHTFRGLMGSMPLQIRAVLLAQMQSTRYEAGGCNVVAGQYAFVSALSVLAKNYLN